MRQYSTYLSNLFYSLFAVVFFSTAAIARPLPIPAPTIAINHFDNTGSYAPGSSISVHVTTDGDFPLTNSFELVLSDASGVFTASSPIIGTRSDFFTPIMVGTIPSTTPAGTGYKLKVRSVLNAGIPGPEVILSTPFTIQSGTGHDVNITLTGSITTLSTLINCLPSDQYAFGFTDQSFSAVTPSSPGMWQFKISNFDNSAFEYAASLFKEISTGVFQEIPLAITTSGLAAGAVSITSGLPVGYYPIKVRVRNRSTNTISTKSYIFLFNTGNTGLANLSSENICAGTNVNFIADTAAMSNNYPGSKYTINFGDCIANGTTPSGDVSYTHYQIYNSPTLVKNYTNPTCQSTCAVIFNNKKYYAVKLNLWNKGLVLNPPVANTCSVFNVNGNGTIKYVNVSIPPAANFTTNQRICRGTAILATNTTTPGAFGFGATCSTDYQSYWYIKSPRDTDPVLVSSPTDPSFGYPNLNFPANLVDIAGCWEITLQVKNISGCETVSTITKVVKVEAPLTADFSISPASPICFNQTVTLTDLSGAVTACTSATYSWSITPATGWTFTGGTNINSPNPQIIFTTPGTYTITQSITNVCGTYTKSKTITVNGDPSVTIPAGPFNFCAFPPPPVSVIVDFSNVLYKPTYTAAPFAPTSYTWTVDGAASDYEFLTATNVAFPIIKFKEFRTYNVTITVNGNCSGSNSKTYVINVKPKPTITNVNLDQVICSGTSTAPTTLTPDLAGTTFSWSAVSSPSAGLSPSTTSGTANPIPAILLTNITPNSIATFTYTITPSLNGCSGSPQSMVITVNPTATVNAISNQVVCNGGNTTAITFGSPTTGGTIVYNWTNNNTSIGLGASGTGNIPSFAAVNAGTSPVTANITVTPSYTSGGLTCTGTPKSFSITVNPTAQVNTVANQVVCNGANTTAITFGTGNTGGTTTYSWVNNTPSIGLLASGTGNIASFTAVNNGTAPVTATITVTPTFTNGSVPCTGPTTSFTITVNPKATVNAVSNQVVCNGEATTAVSFGSPTTGGTIVYNWTNNNTTIGLGGSGAGDIASFTAVNTGTSPVTAIISVTPAYTNAGVTCNGTPRSFTIIVNPTAQVNTVSNQTVCNGTNTTAITFGTVNTGGTTTYSWTNDNTTIGLGASGSGNIAAFTAVNTGTSPVTATITVTPTFTNGSVPCTGPAKTFTITVNPTVTVNPISNQVVCNGDATTAVSFGSTATGGTIVYNWTNSTTSIGLGASGVGDIASFTAVNTGTAPVTATITVTPRFTNGSVGCNGTPRSFTIIVNPTAQVNTVSNQVVCNGANTTAIAFGTVNTGGTTTYSWTNDNTTIGLGASGSGNIAAFAAVNTGTSPVTAIITVTPTFTNLGVSCSGPAKTFTITVSPTPTVNAVSNQVVCNGGNTTAVTFGGSVAGTTYLWTNNTPSIGLLASGTGNIASFVAVNTGTAPVTATITVTPRFTNGSAICDGTPTSFTITVNPTATVNAVSNQVVCNGGNTTAVTFSSPTTGGTIVYNWTNNNTSIGLGASGAGDIASFAAINSGTAPVTATITITPAYTNGGVTCNGTPRSFTIIVNPTAQVNTVANQTVCNGGNTTAITFSTGNTGGTTTYSWVNNTPSIGLLASGSGNIAVFTAVNTGSSPVTATITVTPTFTNGSVPCSGPAKTFTITVNPTATVNPVSNQVVCNGDATTAVSFGSPTTGGTIVYNWVNNTTSIGLGASGAGDMASFTAVNTGTSPVTATITVTPAYTNGGVTCNGTPRSFTITVNPTAQVNTVTNQTVCNGSNTTAITFGTANTVGTTTYSWTNDNTTIGLGVSGSGNIGAFTAINTGTTPVTATITVTPTFTNGSVPCTGPSKTFTITVNPTPTVNAVSNQLVCNGGNTAAVTFGGAVVGTTYLWTNNTPSIGLSASGTGDIASFTAINTGTAPVTATITVTPRFTNGSVGCDGTPTTFTIKVNPSAQVNTVSNQVVCNGTNTTAITFGTANTAGTTTYSWTNDNTAIGLGASGAGDIAPFTAVNSGTSPITANITVTPVYSSGGVTCNGTPKSFTITVNPGATINPVSNQLVCAGANTTAVTFGGTVAGTTYLWTNDTPSIGLGASGTGDIASFTAVNTGISPVTATITVTPRFINGSVGCNGSPTSFTITVNPSAQVNPLSNQVVCTGDATTAVSFGSTATGGTIVFNWTNNNTTIGLGASGTGDIASFTAVNSGTAPVTATITITPVYTSGGLTCNGTPRTFTITVNPTAQVNSVNNQVACNGTNTTAIVFGTVNTGGATTYSWTNDNATIGVAASGTGNINAFAAVNTGTAPVMATITVTPTFTNGGVSCTGPPTSFTITVNPTATVNAVSNQVLCNGDATTAVSFGSTATGGTIVYNWTNSTPSIGLLASGNGDIASFTAVNTGTSPVTATITVTPAYTNGSLTCNGTPRNFTIIVNPTAQVNTVSNQVVCNGANTTAINFSTTNTAGTTTYIWTNDNTTIGLGASGAGNIAAFAAVNTGTSPVTATITVTPTFTNLGVSCTGPSKTFTITVNPTPTVNAVSNQLVCNGDNTTAVTFGGAVVGTTYLWTNNTPSIGLSASGTGDIASFTAINTGTAPVMATITVTPRFTNGSVGCDGTPTTFTITVNPSAQVNAVSNQLVCNGANTTAVNFGTANTAGTTTYSWSNNNTTIGLGASGTGNIAAFAAVNTGTSPVTAMITVTPTFTNGGVSCTGPAKTFTITVNPTAQVNSVNNQVVCNGANTTAINFGTANTGGTTTYSWTNDNNTIGLGASGTGNIAAFAAVNTGTAPVTATITVTPTFTNGGVPCTGPTTSFTITVNPTATVNVVSNQVVCNGGNTTAVTFSSPATGGTVVYNWTNNNTAIGLSANGTGDLASFTAINTGTLPVTATISVTAQYTNGAAACNGIPRTFTITVNPTAQVNSVNNQVVCNGANTTAISFGTGNTSGTTTYSWVNSTPSIGLGASGTGNIAAFAAVNTGTSPVTATITATPTFTNGGVPCTGPTTSFTITVNPTATVNAVSNQVLCNGDATTAVSFGSTATGGSIVYNWTNSTPSIGLAASGTGDIASFTAVNTGTTPVTATITVTPRFTNGSVGCNGTPTTFTITVNPTAQVNNISNQVVCNGANTTAVNFGTVNTGGTTTYSWTNDNTTIGLGASGTGNIAAFAAVNTGTAPVTATITVTPTFTNGGVPCTGPAKTFTITVNPTAQVNAVINQVVCNGANTTAISFGTGNTSGTTTYSWVNSTPSIGLGASGTGNIAAFAAVNTGTSPVTATITVTPTFTNGGVPCTGPTTSFTITVNPTATVNVISNQVVCNSGNTTSVTFSTPTTGGTVVYNWTNSTPSIGLSASGTGDIASFTAVNTGTSPVTATISVTAQYTNGAAACNGIPRTFTITVNPTAQVNAVNNQVVCNGANTTAVNFGTVNTGGTTTYSWTNDNITIGLGASGTGNIGAFAAVNTGTSPVTATITVTPTFTNGGVSCTGPAKTFTITVNPSAQVNAVSNQVLCNGDATAAVSFGSTAIGGAIVYNWTNSTPSIGLSANGTGDIASFTAVNTGTTPVTATITVTAQYTNGAAACNGIPRTFTITVNPTAQVNTVSNQVVCNGANTTAINFGTANTGGTTTYSWTNNNTTIGLGASGSGNIAAFAAVNTGTAPVTATITVTPTFTNGGVSCTGPAKTFTITVNPTATVNTVSNQVLCNGGTTTSVSFGSTATGGTIVYNWTNNTPSIGLAASGTGDIASFTAVNTGTTPVTATITVTPRFTNGSVGCNGTPTTFTITVNPTAQVNNISNQVVCNGGNTTAIVFGSTATGGTVVYNWTNNTTSIGLGASGTGDIASFAAVNTGIVPVTATITVTPVYTNGSVTCSGTSKSFTITVNPTPTVNAVTNQVVCNGGNTTAVIFGGAVAGTTYLWTNSNPSTGLGASGTGNIAAFAAVNTGTAPVTATITVTPRYTNGSVSCNGTPTTFTITVNPSAQVNTVPNQVVCHEDNTVSIAFGTNNTGGITNYSWTNNTPSIGLGASGTGNIAAFAAVNTGTAPVTATITVTPQYTNGGVNCSGTPKTFTIRVNPSAKAQINIDNVIGCAPYRIRDHVTLVPHVTANSQPAFAWYANGVLIGTGATVPNYVITQPGDTVVLKLVAKSLYGCKDDSVSTTIYTIQEPRPSFTLSADTACGPATILIQNTTVPIGVINGSAYSWNFGNGQVSSLVQPGSVTFLANDLQQRDTTYYITLTVTTACQTLSVRDSVLIRPKPKALFQPDTSVYCSPANMRFRNNSRGVNNAFGPSNKYIWDWGDGRRDTVYDNRTMTQRYTTGVLDTITVKLYAFNECGVDSFSVDVLLYPATITPSLIVFGQNTFGCAPRPVTFVNNSVGGTLYTIDFGAGTPPYITNNSNDTISYTYINPGTYTVSMRAQNSCTDTTVYQTIDIYPNPVADFNFSSVNYCARDTVRITNLSTPSGIQYTWSMGDGTLSFSGVTNPNYLYQNPGTYTVTLIAANTFATGATCRDTAQRQVTILPVPTAVFTTNLSTYNCAPFTLTANATPANYSSVEWFVQTAAGITLYSTTGFTFNHTLLTAGNYQLKMIAYNANGCKDSLTTPFTVSGSPIVSYSVADTVYCGLSATVNFTNTTTNVGSGTLAYQWSVNGVVLSNSATTFTHTFSIPANATAPVVFNVRLVSTASVTGCAPAYERTITLLPAGQVNIPANQVVCDGGVVPATAFTTQNTGGTTTYQWTNDTPSIGLPASGTGNISSFVGVNVGLLPITATIRVTPTFSYGGRSCPGTPTTYTITINPAAQVNQPANLTVCNGQLTSVNFSTSTTGGVTTYSWTNDNPSIGVLPSNTGNIPLFAAINITNSPVVATISVTPSYTSGGVTCTGAPKTFTITVLPTPQVDQPSNQIVCTGSTVSFGFSSPTTGGIVSYRWTNSNTATGLATSGFGSSVSFISTNNTNSPIVSVVTVTPTLTLSGRSCDGPAKTFTITVNPSGQVNQPPSQVKCNGDLALGTRFGTLLTGGTVGYSWTNTTPAIGLAPFGSGDIDSFRVVNTGTAPLIATITVTPTFINGGVACPGQPKSFTITVNPSPTVNPLPNLQYCDGNRTTPISFTSPASGGSITYNWSNSNAAIGLPLSGIGTIPSFTATNPTAVPIVATITVTPSFSNGGINCGGIPRTFTITVLPLPQTLFRVTPDSACAPMVVTFSNLTQFADTYQWSVNGVPFSTAATPPPMVLTQAGTTFVFTLVAGNSQGGCGPTSFSYTVKTLPTPRSQFSLNGSLADTLYACKQLTVQATNTSYLNTPGNVVGLTYQWYVNGQLLSTGLNPQFQLRNISYTRDTLIKVKLVAASSSGCIDSAMRWVRLYPEPLASFSIVGGAANCARPRSGLVKTVQNLSLVKPPAVFTWTVFNRTSPLPQQHGVIISNPAAATPTFTFPDNLSAADSTYEIYLLVKSADGCTKDTSLTQVVYARPIVNFRMTDSVSCTGSLNVSFLDLSVSPTSSITTRLWNFDDGTATSTLPAVSHIYSNYGVYRPWLYVSNARGCVSDTMRKRVVVFGPPVADFTATTPVCLGSPVTFVNTSQLGWGSTQFSQVLWDFGGGVTSTVFSPTHIYTAPGIYTVTLTILSDSSCVIRKKSMQITVIGKPKADFSFNSRCVGSTVQFINLSTAGYADGGFSTAQWNFGNGLQSIQLNPTTVYNTPGSYPVQLIVGGVSCPQLSDTIVKTLVVTRARPDSIYPLIYATRLNRFTMQALPGGVNYLWTPPIGLIQPNRRVTDAYYLSNDPSRIDYTITIKDSSGCVNHDKQEVWIFDKPNVFAPTAFTPNRDNINDVFIPIYVNIATLQSFRIFSRWGVKIFETNDLRKGWDGTINGQTAPLETYSWVVECFDINGNKLIRKGMVTLLRY